MLACLRRQLGSGEWLGRALRSRSEGRWGEAESRVVVEFSSPNVAKPFHVGHLRSTLVGDWVASLLEAAGHRVERLNWLGDWGAQFGVLALGWERFGKGRDVRSLADLYQVYVQASAAAEAEPDFRAESRRLFAAMEAGDADALRLREDVFRASQAQYLQTYQSLGVLFHRWDAESMYAQLAKDLLRRLEGQGRLVTEDGAVGVRDPDSGDFLLLQKGDRATVYLSRDVAAVLDRLSRGPERPSRLFYVVDGSQAPHFERIRKVLRVAGEEAAAEAVVHLPFGRVDGMSSRKGDAVLVDEVLAEGQAAARRLLTSSKTCRLGPEELAEASAELALSALRVADLRRRRRASHRFSWSASLRMASRKGEMRRTGALLQYRYARLTSLLERAEEGLGAEAVKTLDGVEEAELREPEARTLLAVLLRLPGSLGESYAELESQPIAGLAFELARALGSATKRLKVLHPSVPPPTAKARLALFVTARETLATLMKLLNLKPMPRI